MSKRLLLTLFVSVVYVVAAKQPVTPAVASQRTGRHGMSSIVWAPGGERFVYQKDGQLHLYETASGETRVLVRLSDLKENAVSVPAPARFGWRNRRVREREVQWFPGEKRLLIKAGGDLFVYPLDGGKWTQFTATGVDEADPKVSPDGRRVAFRRGGELYVMDVASRKVKRLTKGGGATRWNGKLDWVYPEELDLGTAYWWSPDGRWIAYLRFDVSREPLYPHADLMKLAPVYEPQRFPKAGNPNADVRLGVIAAKGGGTRWLDEVAGDSELMVRVDWLRDSSGLLVQKANRIQNRLELRRVPLRGKAATIIEEKDEHWVNFSDAYRVLERSDRLVWSSERSGFRHLYLYSLDGSELGRITSGEWEVTELVGVDEEAERVYYLSTKASPLERHLYVTGFGGGEKKKLTGKAGVHSISMGPKCRYYLDTHSAMGRPPVKELHEAGGKLVRVVQPADRRTLEEYEILPQEVLKLRAGDGTLLYGRVVKPAGFVKGRKYPAVVLVYGGPHSQTIMNAWSGTDLRQMLAQAGFVVWQLDNRGSAGRGHVWETKLFRRFGKQELADQVRGVEYLVSLGYVDAKRVGIHGWSYGGFMTTYAMLHAPETFAAGVAGAPVTNWRNYDTIYTERYLGLPAENEEGYRLSSPVNFAEKLRGPLLLVHNIEDDNVLFQNTMQLAAGLQKAAKPFGMMVYTQKTHGVSGRERKHLYQTILDFFERNLR